MKGIYQYKDLKTGDIVYVGKDSHIDKNQRYKDHNNPKKYDEQQINRVLQNNLHRYEYSVLCSGEYTDLQLNKLERLFIKIFNPKFNFTKGGDGAPIGNQYRKGKTHSEESKQKMSESHKGEKNHMFGKHHSEKTKQKISRANKGKVSPRRGVKLSNKTKKKISESHKGKTHLKGKENPNWKKYARIIKKGKQSNGKQKYAIIRNGKKIKQSINISTLINWFKENYPNEQLINEVNT